ncbi:ATP-binding protein [Planctomycetota bacterium]
MKLGTYGKVVCLFMVVNGLLVWMLSLGFLGIIRTQLAEEGDFFAHNHPAVSTASTPSGSSAEPADSRQTRFVRAQQITLAYGVGVYLLATGAGILLLRRWLGTPLGTLTKGVESIAQGDFNRSIWLEGNGELAHLATGINRINRELQQFAEEAAPRLKDDHHEVGGCRVCQFATSVAHDLKAPLGGIKTLATWIHDDYSQSLDEAGKEKLLLLVQRVKRMENLILGIQHYMRCGHHETTDETVDTCELVNNIVADIAVPETMTVDVAETLPRVKGNRTQLLQIFQNLISNAVKYMDKPEGYVRVTGQEVAMGWEFCVQDNGPGIAPAYHEKIFQMFQTLAPRDEVEGCGIGLAIVKKTVEINGGRVWIQSHVGKGCAFHFTLPTAIERKNHEEQQTCTAGRR